MAYCETADLLLGNVVSKPADQDRFVNDAADEIDSRIGFMYATPIVVGESAEQRPVKMLLKKINSWLASGRLIMALDAGGEDDQIHQYGLYLVSEAQKVLESITSGEIVLPGVDPASPDSTGIVTGPQYTTGDDASLVESFGSVFGDPAKVALVLPRPIPCRNYTTW